MCTDPRAPSAPQPRGLVRQPSRSGQANATAAAIPVACVRPGPCASPLSCRRRPPRPLPCGRSRERNAMTNHAESIIHEVMASDTYRTAVATLTAEHDRTVEDIIALTQVAAPSFDEGNRARTFLAMAEAHGLKNLAIDAEGNVTGMRPGIGNGPLICVAAHLDTVFPAGTDLTVRREGTKLFAPGVGDDTRSLAVLLAWLRAMD